MGSLAALVSAIASHRFSLGVWLEDTEAHTHSNRRKIHKTEQNLIRSAITRIIIIKKGTSSILIPSSEDEKMFFCSIKRSGCHAYEYQALFVAGLMFQRHLADSVSFSGSSALLSTESAWRDHMFQVRNSSAECCREGLQRCPRCPPAHRMKVR